MDLSSINSALLPLQNSLADQSSMGAIAAEDGQKADLEASDGTGQDLPSADAGQAASAMSGASSAALSPEMQALLLQAQESSAAAGLLLGQGGAASAGDLSAASTSSDQSTALMRAILSDFLNSASANTSIGASNQALLDLMGETGAVELAE